MYNKGALLLIKGLNNCGDYLIQNVFLETYKAHKTKQSFVLIIDKIEL